VKTRTETKGMSKMDEDKDDKEIGEDKDVTEWMKNSVDINDH
jgi:hypothetical protein